jgi:ArsR family transcriptional regulator
MSSKPTSVDLKFRAFSDRTRLRILHLLLQGELCVCDIVRAIGIPQPTASRHLSYLRKARLVVAKRKGRWMFYTLASAKTAFDQNLLDCLANCFEGVNEVGLDNSRLKKLRERGDCC